MTNQPLTILPQHWAEGFRPLPEGWLQTHAPGLLRRLPEFPSLLRDAAQGVGVAEHLLVARCQLEQSAITYAWDGSTTDYGGGHNGELYKLQYLCGADRTDSGDRPGGWFGPAQQLLACALRFHYWYRGKDGPRPEWRNWLGLEEDPAFRPGVPVTRQGATIVPANQISADCLRYTTGMDAQVHLQQIARGWFPEEYAITPGGISSMSTLTQLAPTMEQFGAWLKSQKPGHGQILATVLHHTEEPTAAQYRGLSTIQGIKQYHLGKGWSDIGAQAYACPDGTVFTGRPLSADNLCHAGPPWRSDVEAEARALSGGDTMWFNKHAFGLETVANFDNEDPFGSSPAAQSYETAMKVMTVMHLVFNLDSTRLFFHRNVADKTCPGMKLSRADVRHDLHNRLLAARGALAEAGLHLYYDGKEIVCQLEEVQRGGQSVGRGDVRAIVEALGYQLKYTAVPGGGRLDVVKTA